MFTAFIVDDDAVILDQIINTVPWMDNGFEVIGSSTSPLTAIEEISKVLPDVVFTDLRMPEMDGVEMIRALSHKNISCEYVMLSAYGTFADSKRFFKESGFDYLLKPINQKEVQFVLEALAQKLVLKKPVPPVTDTINTNPAFLDLVEYLNCNFQLNELYMLEQYVDIMQIRYPQRFDVEFDAEEELDDVDIPRMLVQPIVENAISHGLLTAQNGKLYISARVDGEVLIFKVQDNGKGMIPEALQELQSKIQHAPGNPWGEKGLEHVALPNIQKRVVSMFGKEYGLVIASTLGQGTTVTLTLPAYFKQEIM